MRKFLFLMLYACSVSLMAVMQPPAKKHTLGVDLTYPMLANLRYEQGAFEVFYRYHLSDRIFIHESVGVANRNTEYQGNPLPQLTKYNGFFNRAGVHFQLYKPYWFNRKNFEKTSVKESSSIGLNLLTGVQSYQLRFNTYGQLLLPYQVNEKGKLAYVGLEAQWSFNILRIENFQLNYMLRYGRLFTTKKSVNFERFAALAGTGINNDPFVYVEPLGLYALYRF